MVDECPDPLEVAVPDSLDVVHALLALHLPGRLHLLLQALQLPLDLLDQLTHIRPIHYPIIIPNPRCTHIVYNPLKCHLNSPAV